MTQRPRFLAQFAGLAVLSLGAVMFAQDSADRLVNPDAAFAVKTAQGGMAEIKMGELAAQKASNADVKAFGQQMVTDHTKANDELKQIAARKGVTLPGEIGAKDQAAYDNLAKLEGDAFDRAYIADMVNGHRAVAAEFEKEANSGTDPDIKDFASKTLPTVKHHLEMAESAEAKLKK